MPTPPLYTDIDFKLTKVFVGPQSVDVSVKQDLNAIFQSIKNIILTTPTEKPFSTIGGGLYDYKFEKMSDVELMVLNQKIRSTITVLEPRAIINSINIIRNYQGKQDTLGIEIDFSPVYDPAIIKKGSIRI